MLKQADAKSHSTLASLMVLTVQIIAKLMALIATLYAARRVGTSEYGLYTYALSVAAIAGIATDLGLSPFLVREMAANPGRAEPLFNAVLGLRILGGLGLMAAMGVVPLMGHAAQQMGALLVMVGLYTVLSQIADTFARGFAACEAWTSFNRVTLLGQVLGLFLSVSLLVKWPHVLALPVGLSLGYVAAVWYSWRSISRSWFAARPVYSPGAWRRILVAAMPFTAGAVVSLINQRVDTLLLYHAAGSTAVAMYGASFSLLFSLSIVPGACSSVLAPKLAAHSEGDLSGATGLMRLFLKALLAVSLPAAAGVTLLARWLAPMLFGTAFADMAPVLALLGWWLPAMFVQTLLVAAYGALGKQHIVVKVIAASVAAAVLIGYPMQVRWGALGAAGARTLIDWVGMILLLALFPWRRNVLPTVGDLLKIGLATLGMSGLVWLLSGRSIVVAIVAGALVYAVLLLLFGCFTAAELPVLTYLKMRPFSAGGDHNDATVGR